MNKEKIATTEVEKLPESPFSFKWKKSDAVLVVDGRKLHVHSLVLSLHSAVFEAMFTSGFAESNTKEVSLPGKDYKSVENLLKMIYPGNSLNLWEVSLEDVDGLLSLVREYMIDSIKNQIEKHLSHNLLEKLYNKDFSKLKLTKEIIKIFKIADEHDFHDVMCKGAKYVSENYSYLNSWSGFSKDFCGHKFRDKYMVKFMAHIINKQTEIMKSDFKSVCQTCKLTPNVSRTFKMISDIEINSKIMMEDSFLKVDN